MPKIVQIVRQASPTVLSYVGPESQLVHDTTSGTLRVHDGTTAGGTRLGTYAEITAAQAAAISSAAIYTDAQIAAIDLSEIQLTPKVAPAYSEGLLFYDSDTKTLSFYNDEPDVTVNVSQELHVRARNSTGSTIPNMAAVVLTGSTGSNPTMALANATTLAGHFVGLATHSIENNTSGYVTTYGYVNGLNTAAFTEGASVYVDPAVVGGLTETKPTGTDYSIPIGIVIRSHASLGVIFVHPDEPIDLSDISVAGSLGGGATGTPHNLGNLSAATTLSIADGNIQYGTVTGSFTLTAPADTGCGYIDMELLIDATGGYTVTLTGFDQITGTLATAANALNVLTVSKLNTKTLLTIEQVV